MLLLDRSLPDPEANLRLDHWLLERCERDPEHEVLRFWEPNRHFIVLGLGGRADTEVDADACRRLGLPVLRRASGGGAVLQGPGCLNYTLILRKDGAPALHSIAGTNRYVLERHRRALQPLVREPITREGWTDLALRGRKFSGNSQRRGRNALLFHGTFLLDLDVRLLERVLPLPPREPPYRAGRSHREFLTRLPLPAETVKEALAAEWNAKVPARPGAILL